MVLPHAPHQPHACLFFVLFLLLGTPYCLLAAGFG
jgi:hypothetical protein